MRFRSIMLQVVFLHTIAIVCAAVILPLMLYKTLDADVDQLQQDALKDKALRIVDHLKRKEGGWSLDLPAGLRDQYSQAYGRYSYVILDDAGVPLFSSRPDETHLYPVDDDGKTTSFYQETTTRGARTIAGVSMKRSLDGRSVWVQVSENLSHRDVIVDDLVANYFNQVGWITAPVLIFLVAVDFLILRRAVRPLLDASAKARSIGPERIDLRLPVRNIPIEIRPLVVAVNQAFDRLERAFRAQRDFAADVAHELRTPLTILRGRIETLSDKATRSTLNDDVVGMTRVVNQLLDAADLETVVIDWNEKVSLHDICVEIAAFLTPLALSQGKQISVTSARNLDVIPGNAEMLRRAIRNLVENALRHTRDGSVVELVVRSSSCVSVLDRGPGIPVGERALIFQRFWRRDRRAGSVGLGLAIVKRIVEAHGGDVEVCDRAGGGSEFIMALLPRDEWHDDDLVESDGARSASLL